MCSTKDFLFIPFNYKSNRRKYIEICIFFPLNHFSLVSNTIRRSLVVEKMRKLVVLDLFHFINLIMILRYYLPQIWVFSFWCIQYNSGGRAGGVTLPVSLGSNLASNTNRVHPFSWSVLVTCLNIEILFYEICFKFLKKLVIFIICTNYRIKRTLRAMGIIFLNDNGRSKYLFVEDFGKFRINYVSKSKVHIIEKCNSEL